MSLKSAVALSFQERYQTNYIMKYQLEASLEALIL